MSRPRTATSQAVAAQPRRPPFVSALLRMTYEVTRRRVLKALMDRGFTDLNQAHLSVFQYPPPEGVRPTDLADRTYMTKQAMNYLLGQLQSLGYIERRAERGQSRRLVFLTPRGRQVVETQWATTQQLEKEWAAIVGQKRFEEFTGTLRELSSLNSNGGI
jgi:DNA-binding MarR family transcriptional regulator